MDSKQVIGIELEGIHAMVIGLIEAMREAPFGKLFEFYGWVVQCKKQ